MGEKAYTKVNQVENCTDKIGEVLHQKFEIDVPAWRGAVWVPKEKWDGLTEEEQDQMIGILSGTLDNSALSCAAKWSQMFNSTKESTNAS